MKIKTVWTADTVNFDDQVNQALKNGYQLVKRELVPAPHLDDTVYYAELVLPDEPDEPEEPEEQESPVPFTPLGALHVIQDACFGTNDKDCLYKCPLRPWCNQLRDGGDPTDWDLSQLEADA